MRDFSATLLLFLALLVGTASSCLADELMHDPTRPWTVSVPGVATNNFKVNAIIISTERRIAILNGQRVAVGASVHGATIVAIETDHLVLERNGKRIVARLSHGASRR